MSSAQLLALGGVAPVIDPAPAGQVDFQWLRATDLKLAWRHTFRERFTVEPSVGFYNIFNFSNFNLPPTTMNGLLFGAGSGSINGYAQRQRAIPCRQWYRRVFAGIIEADGVRHEVRVLAAP